MAWAENLLPEFSLLVVFIIGIRMTMLWMMINMKKN